MGFPLTPPACRKADMMEAMSRPTFEENLALAGDVGAVRGTHVAEFAAEEELEARELALDVVRVDASDGIAEALVV
eukprot:9476617-Pyramimonas_sp.AAC.1